MHSWVPVQEPRYRTPSLWDQECWCAWIVLLPFFWVTLALLQHHCLASPLPPPLPPDPCSEQHSLILSRGPASCTSQSRVLSVTCELELWHFLCYEFTLLSSWTWAQNSAGGDSCRLSSFFSVACQGTTLHVWLTISQAGSEGVNFLVTLLWGFLLRYCRDSSYCSAKDNGGEALLVPAHGHNLLAWTKIFSWVEDNQDYFPAIRNK